MQHKILPCLSLSNMYCFSQYMSVQSLVGYYDCIYLSFMFTFIVYMTLQLFVTRTQYSKNHTPFVGVLLGI